MQVLLPDCTPLIKSKKRNRWGNWSKIKETLFAIKLSWENRRCPFWKFWTIKSDPTLNHRKAFFLKQTLQNIFGHISPLCANWKHSTFTLSRISRNGYAAAATFFHSKQRREIHKKMRSWNFLLGRWSEYSDEVRYTQKPKTWWGNKKIVRPNPEKWNPNLNPIPEFWLPTFVYTKNSTFMKPKPVFCCPTTSLDLSLGEGER